MLDAPTSGQARIIYLAGPYSHPDARVREARYQSITAVAAQLIGKGLVIFSPLTMTHPIDAMLAGGGNTLGSDYWVKFDESFMEFCSELVVLTLDGWEASSGVQREMAFFQSRGRKVTLLHPEQAEQY